MGQTGFFLNEGSGRYNISHLPKVKEIVSGFKSEFLERIATNFDDLQDLYLLLNASIKDNPPLSLKEGGIIRDGYSKELDELRAIKDNAKSWLAALEMKEKKRTGSTGSLGITLRSQSRI